MRCCGFKNQARLLPLQATTHQVALSRLVTFASSDSKSVCASMFANRSSSSSSEVNLAASGSELVYDFHHQTSCQNLTGSELVSSSSCAAKNAIQHRLVKKANPTLQNHLQPTRFNIGL